MEDLLKALLASDSKPEKDVFIKRFGTFRVKALDDQDMERISARATFGKSVDNEMQTLLLIQAGTPSFDWANVSLLEKFGAADALDVIRKALLPGEKQKIVSEILNVSGFDSGEAIEQAKN